MKRDIFYIIAVTILVATSVFFWQRSRALTQRLVLIEQRIEESRREVAALKRAEEARRKEPAPEPLAKVAIVLDDFGYRFDNLRAVWELGVPVTLSILPNLPYSEKVAEAAAAKGQEVILHLPMEPHEKLRLEKGTIMTAMTGDEIDIVLEEAISGVPGLAGVSNHMGSKATEDERVMSLVLNKLKERNLFFLDSYVTLDSVCERLCREKGVKFLIRSVFLDNEPDIDYIKAQIERLAGEALGTGRAVGIGHDRAHTLSALKEMAPVVRDMGIEFVPASELAE